MSKKILVVGAGSAIAQAFITQCQKNNENVYAVSRHLIDGDILKCVSHFHQLDYSEESIANFIQSLGKEAQGSFDGIYIFLGILHNDDFMPEKRVGQINLDQMMQTFQANTFIPMLWVKHALKLLKKKQATELVCLSARVGSISDNGLGGWYSYRSSKSALNMMLKSFSIEARRTHPLLKVTAFHPGTNDTPLSKPFQKNVPGGKIISAILACDKNARGFKPSSRVRRKFLLSRLAR